MITIEPGTFAVATAREEQAFLQRLGRFVCEQVPETAAQPAEPFDAQLRLVIQQARQAGFVSERAVASYALTAARLGPDFPDRFPAARSILLDDATEAKKVENLETLTTSLFEALEQ